MNKTILTLGKTKKVTAEDLESEIVGVITKNSQGAYFFFSF